jgi:hypothetical protein
MIQREAAYQALSDRLQSAMAGTPAPGWEWSFGRTYRDFDDPQVLQPACLVVVRDQRPMVQSGMPTRWELGAGVLIYFQNKDPDTETDTLVNGVIDAVEGALVATADEADGTGEMHTTLGGIVLRAWIDGQLGVFQGLPGDQTVIVIPVTMLAA